MDDDTLSPNHPGGPHRRAWDAIPWVAAGVASPEDSQQVLLHLPQCSECRAEWALHQRVGNVLKAPETAPPPAVCADEGWQRMVARLDEEAAADSAVPAPVAARMQAAAPWTRWLVAAVVVQAVGLGAAGLALHDAAGNDERPGEFRTRSAAGAVLAIPAGVRLVPAPEMTFGSLQALLSGTGMVVVEVAADGSSLGLAAADGRAVAVEAAVPRLRAAPDVLLAEPVAPGGR